MRHQPRRCVLKPCTKMTASRPPCGPPNAACAMSARKSTAEVWSTSDVVRKSVLGFGLLCLRGNSIWPRARSGGMDTSKRANCITSDRPEPYRPVSGSIIRVVPTKTVWIAPTPAACGASVISPRGVPEAKTRTNQRNRANQCPHPQRSDGHVTKRSRVFIKAHTC